MDKLEQVLSNMIVGQKSLAESKIQFKQLESQMNQGLCKNAEWLYKKDQQIGKINNEFDMIRKEIR